MRRLLPLLCALALLAVPGAAPAASPPGSGTGGAAAPSSGGGLTYGQPVQKVRRASRRSFPVATKFSVAPATLVSGAPAVFAFRIDGPMRKVRVRIELTAPGARTPTARLRLGYRRTGVAYRYPWTPGLGELPAGDYDVTLLAFDDAGRGLRRTAKASGRGRLSVAVAPPPDPATPGVFPVAGPYDFGGADARFGAGRRGHVHQGQDVIAAEGTPLVAPVASVVTWIAFQAGGAGHYVVLRGADGTDYVFMHIKKGTISVVKGAALAAGQAFAQVGNTGASSGPHLHFEIWPQGWYSSKTSAPIDPLPQLQAWAGTG